MVGPLNRNGINNPSPNPGTIISAIEVNRRVDDQFNPACWICSSACLENCMLVNNRFNPVGLSVSISLSRLLTLTAVSPEAVCSMPTTWFFRRASKYFRPEADRQQAEREHDDEGNHDA